VGDIKRVALNGGTLRILIEAEMSKHPECNGCTRWGVEPHTPDETGCNWRFYAGAGVIAAVGCLNRIDEYIGFLRANFDLDDSQF
jgi:hypothetical protein